MNQLILNLLSENTVKAGVVAQDWQEAGRIAGQMLVDNGSVDPGYVDAMIRAVEELGPYIVLGPGVAMFHGRPEDGVKSIGLSVITLRAGVNFDAGDKDPVSLVFALGARDSQSHLELLAELITIIGDTNLVQLLIKAESATEILELINQKLSKKEG
jgi:mannitol/fructose-specific phosphotransferase system IIA component (Ntr-type)